MRTAPTSPALATRYRVGALVAALRGLGFCLPGMGGVVLVALALCAQFWPSAQAIAAPGSPQEDGAEVPFVGCKADGQQGPQDAPTGKPRRLPIAAEAAQRLAYYKSDFGPGVLAPRGWYCAATYGSSGYSLYVAPQQLNAADMLRPTWGRVEGPAIEIAGRDGGTSGRFEVARIIARVFPTHREFAERVIAEGLEPASSFPFGPYPKDKLTYRSPEIVEYETPPNTDGLGTNSRLNKNADPISGVVILRGPETNLLHVSVRLSPSLTDLTPVIIQQAERDAADSHP